GAAAVAVRRAWDGRPCRSNVSAFRQEFDRGEGMEPKTALWRFLKVINERISHESLISRRRARGCLYFGPFAGNGGAGQRATGARAAASWSDRSGSAPDLSVGPDWTVRRSLPGGFAFFYLAVRNT